MPDASSPQENVPVSCATPDDGVNARKEDATFGARDIKNYEPRLNQEWVQVLINLRMKHAKEFTRKRHSATTAWMNIHKEMIELGAPAHITVEKVKKKWMNLIARYKHLKFVLNSSGAITWPYFDQIDRAYARNPNIIELRKNFNSTFKFAESDSENDSVVAYADSMMKRQQFTTNLIKLRGACKHLFTGKKYAAQRGWMVIKNMHPDGDGYTVDQFSKCWQNLTQRYRNLLETEKDRGKITWVHFPTMHEVMECLETYASDKAAAAAAAMTTPSSTAAVIADDASAGAAEIVGHAKLKEEIDEHAALLLKKTTAAAVAAVTSEHELFDEEEENADESQLMYAVEEPLKKRRRSREMRYDDRNKENDAPVEDLLKYLIQRDIQLDEQHEELMKLLNVISTKLDK